ncbi:hypothetical protein SNE26_16435 [Mucilaginibacter sp. cycad4]|nr:hypothetical protein [Mucilaginibacter gossypii]WPU97615.1 hypothetical protein SNE26_16435 [Mucilaginibacter gossypii]
MSKIFLNYFKKQAKKDLSEINDYSKQTPAHFVEVTVHNTSTY